MYSLKARARAILLSDGTFLFFLCLEPDDLLSNWLNERTGFFYILVYGFS